MKRLLFLIIFALPLPLLASDEVRKEIKRPAIETYRHIAEFPYIPMPEGFSGTYRRITVSPKPLPDPLLRYRVNTFAIEKETGNAYPLYLAALKEFNNELRRTERSVFQSEAYRKLDRNKAEEKHEMDHMLFKAFPLYYHWNNGMWTEITLEEESRLYTQTLRKVYLLLEKASKKTYMDWSDQYEFRGIATLLEPIQEARAIARILAGKANWEIRTGKYEDAIRTIRTGLAHADHVLESQPPSFLVGMLVGLACKGIMYNELQRLSAQPDAPNLYPALMQLRHSDRVWLDAIRSEMLWLSPHFSRDDFLDLQNIPSPEQARTYLDGLLTSFMQANNGNESSISIARTAVLLASYQSAKQHLLQKGLSEEEIEALSSYQVVVPFVYERIRRAYDLMQFEAALPMGESSEAFKFDAYVMDLQRNPTSPVDMLLALLTPATQAARGAWHRQTQTLDSLKIVEAIRYYAAVHGKLPASLDEITELPVPKVCPVSGTPYQYRVSGNVAVIDYDLRGSKARIEIVLE
jgi:hypothetical protein